MDTEQDEHRRNDELFAPTSQFEAGLGDARGLIGQGVTEN